MKNIIATINRETSQVVLNTNVLGVVGENLQGNFIVDFKNGFVDGACFLMVQTPKGESGYITMEQDFGAKIYTAPIKSRLLQSAGVLAFQVRITENGVNDNPIFKSDIFSMAVKDCINADSEIPEGYEEWFDIMGGMLSESQELLNEVKELVDSSAITYEVIE